MNGVGRGGGSNVRAETISVDNVNRTVEQTGNVLFQAGVVKNGDSCRRIEFNDVDIAVGKPTGRAILGSNPRSLRADYPTPGGRISFSPSTSER